MNKRTIKIMSNEKSYIIMYLSGRNDNLWFDFKVNIQIRRFDTIKASYLKYFINAIVKENACLD